MKDFRHLHSTADIKPHSEYCTLGCCSKYCDM